MSFINCGIESRNFRILAWAEVCLTSKCPMPSQTTFSSLAKSWSWIQILMLVLWTSIPKQWYLWYYSCLSIQNAKVNTTNVTISKYLLFLCGFGQRVESWNWHIILMDEFLCKFHNEIIQPFLNLKCVPKCVSQHINYQKTTTPKISWYSTPISTFNVLSKWHDPNINGIPLSGKTPPRLL